jgi:hypothetical protein
MFTVRQEFYNIFRNCSGNRNKSIGVVTQMIGQTTQTHIGLTRIREKRNQQDCSMETAKYNYSCFVF